MTLRSYFDHVSTGELDAATALQMKLAREAGRAAGRDILTAAKVRADSAAFGLLDFLATVLVRFYGPADAAAVFRHYAEVCEARSHAREPASDA